MPIYEYVCQKCGHHLEIIQKMSDKPLTKCPECRGRLEKVISQTSFQLKGSGWYVSDYGRGGSKEKTDTTSPTESKTEKSEKAETPSSKPAKAEKTTKKEPATSSSSNGGTTKSD